MSFEPTSLIVVLVFILTFLGAAYGLKTRKGSGINDHPGPDSHDPPHDPELAGSAHPPESEYTESSVLDQHGKK